MSGSSPCWLYLISPPQIEDIASFTASLPAIFNAGDVACLQLRLKDEKDDTIFGAIDALLPVCAQSDVALILNDRPDLAVKTGL